MTSFLKYAPRYGSGGLRGGKICPVGFSGPPIHGALKAAPFVRLSYVWAQWGTFGCAGSVGRSANLLSPRHPFSGGGLGSIEPRRPAMIADHFLISRHQVDRLPIRDVFNLSQALLLALNHVGDATCDQVIHLANLLESSVLGRQCADMETLAMKLLIAQGGSADEDPDMRICIDDAARVLGVAAVRFPFHPAIGE